MNINDPHNSAEHRKELFLIDEHMESKDSNTSTNGGVNQCRICFSDANNDPENPLISPCKCSGSMKAIHIGCLRIWLSRKENVKSSGPNVTSYSWRAYHCELCKSEFQDRIYVNGRMFWLFEITRPTTNFMILESI